ncbi:MAG: NosD domain-containing protein, partial [Candidatus Thermoplasmatota archaeon]|nr:NosD domain-containing protein [Candidatus Thermoplasmatota archaeon]
SCKESLIIENSTDVEIFGSTFERGYLRTNGISVHGSTNLNISTSMFNLTTFPLNITGCSDIELYGNSIGNNTYPVIVKDSVRGRVNKNTFHFQAVGLEMKKSRNINISSNRFNTSTRGLKCSSCVNMEIAENLIEGALVGIELNRTDASKISYNLIKKNDIGLFQNDTFRNIITENLFLDNEKEAVVLDECGSGKIFNNSFVWNNGITTIPFDHRKQVSISSSNFVPWYVKGYGNYWSEYLSPDSDDDGIVDSPFEIVDGGDQDLYPLRFSPYPLASAPLNVECIPGYQSIEMTWEGPEKNLGSSIWGYHIFRGTEPEKLTIMETPGMLPNHYSDTSATPGTRYYYGIRAINEYGEGELSDIVNGYLDDTPPVVEILFPEWGQWINITRLEVRWRGTDNESGLTGYMIKMDNEDWIDAGNLTRYPFFRLLEGRHIFKVQVNNSVGTRTTESLEFFVDTVPPDLRFTCPEVIYSRQPDAFIEWKGSDQGSGIWRYRSKADDGPWSELFTAEYMYVQLVDPVTEITIEARDIAGNSRSRSIMVHYDPDPPILNSQYPGEKIYLNGSQVRIHWSFYDLGSGIEQFRIRTDGLDKYLDWKIQEYLLLNLQEGHHRVNISAIDHAGNMNSTTIEFVIDRTPPEILSYGPVGENVLTDTMIWAVLSEEVQIGTLLFKVLYVKGSLSVTREELFFKPNSALDYGMTYTVELSANDLAGNRLPVSNWTFSTPALGYIVGRVVDKDGRGLKDARVQVSTGSNTMTNEKGYFYLSLPGGTYEVHITKDNYRERTMKVDVTSGMTSDLSDIEIRAEGDLGSLPVIIAIAIIVILVLVAVLIIVIRKKRPRVTDEFYIIDEPPPENTDDPEEVEFEIEF